MPENISLFVLALLAEGESTVEGFCEIGGDTADGAVVDIGGSGGEACNGAEVLG